MELPQPALRLGVLQRQPVAVQVEPVVVEAAAGPGLVLLDVGGVGNGGFAAARVHPARKARHAVGVDAGVDQHHRVAQHLLDGRALGRRQVVHCQQRGVGAAGLVAVHAVAHPEHGGHLTYVEPARHSRVGELVVLGLDLGDVALVCGRGNGEQQQGPVLVGAGVLGDGNAVGGRVHGPHVEQQLVVAGVPFAHFVAQHRGGRWDGRVVADVLGQVVGEVGLRLGRPRKSHQPSQQQKVIFFHKRKR